MDNKLIPIKTTCPECEGHGVIETGGTFTLCGRVHPQVQRCSNCDGVGTLIDWVDVRQLFQLLDVLKAEQEYQ
ncbi:hypothetical protein ACFLXB_04170 [Chloroflexota bacterium]